MAISKKTFRYAKIFLLYWLLFGIIFPPLLIYFNHDTSILYTDYTLREAIKHDGFLNVLPFSMTISLAQLFFIFSISFCYVKKGKIIILFFLLYAFIIPMNITALSRLSIITLCLPFVFWYFYFKYLKNKSIDKELEWSWGKNAMAIIIIYAILLLIICGSMGKREYPNWSF